MLRLRSRRTANTEIARRRVLRDPDLQRRFERDGHIVVPLLDHGQVELVKDVRRTHGPAPGDPRTGLFNDTWSTDVGYKRTVMDTLSDLMASSIVEWLDRHRVMGLVHIVKWPGEAGNVVAHRDPTFVDEDRFRSLAVWCALDDLSDDDGPLRVVPGSHDLPSAVRVHQSPDNLYPFVDEQVETFSTPIHLRAGDAILYDHRLIHLSEQNRGEQERTVVAGIIVPSEARTVYAVTTQSGDEVVEIGDDFFVEHQLNELDIDEVLGACKRVGPATKHAEALTASDLQRLQRSRRRGRR